MPICNKCKCELPAEMFHKRIFKNGKISVQPTCKACKKIISRKRYELKGDIIRQKNKEWRDTHAEEMRKIRKAWWEKHPKMGAFYTALYRARRNENINPQLTTSELEEIREIYLNRPDGYVVDHIIPRHGRDGSRGLHIPSNLQYLTNHENCVKSNKLPV